MGLLCSPACLISRGHVLLSTTATYSYSCILAISSSVTFLHQSPNSGTPTTLLIITLAVLMRLLVLLPFNSLPTQQSPSSLSLHTPASPTLQTIFTAAGSSLFPRLPCHRLTVALIFLQREQVGLTVHSTPTSNEPSHRLPSLCATLRNSDLKHSPSSSDLQPTPFSFALHRQLGLHTRAGMPLSLLWTSSCMIQQRTWSSG